MRIASFELPKMRFHLVFGCSVLIGVWKDFTVCCNV